MLQFEAEIEQNITVSLGKKQNRPVFRNNSMRSVLSLQVTHAHKKSFKKKKKEKHW